MSGTIWRVYTESERDAAGRLLDLLNTYCFPAGESRAETRWRMERWEGTGFDGFALTLCLDVPDVSEAANVSDVPDAAAETFARRAGMGLAHYVRVVTEPGMIRELLRTEYGVAAASEADELCAEAERRLAAEWGRRGGMMADAFAACLMQNRTVHLEGFIRFRLGAVRLQVREALQSVWAERLSDRQYKEFTSLLRLLVECQEARMPAVYVLHAGGHAFRLYDDRMQPLLLAPGDSGRTGADVGSHGTEDDGGSGDGESRIVSSLLAFSPRRIYIYTQEPDARVIRTLVGIFGDRAAVRSVRMPH